MENQEDPRVRSRSHWTDHGQREGPKLLCTSALDWTALYRCIALLCISALACSAPRHCIGLLCIEVCACRSRLIRFETLYGSTSRLVQASAGAPRFTLSLAVDSGCRFSVQLSVLAVDSHSGCRFSVQLSVLAVNCASLSMRALATGCADCCGCTGGLILASAN